MGTAGSDYNYYGLSVTSGITFVTYEELAANYGYAGGIEANSPAATIEIINPFLSKPTIISSIYYSSNTFASIGGRENSSASFTQFQLSPSTGTLTGGTIAVYGYRKA